MYSVDVSSQFVFDPVREYRPYVMVAAGHRFASRGRIQLGELVSEPLIMLDVHPSRLNTEHIFGSLDLRPKIGHTSTSFELVRCLVARGLGYSVLFQRPASRMTYDGNELVMLELDDRVEGTVVGLARPAGAPRTARHDALLAYFAATAASAGARDSE